VRLAEFNFGKEDSPAFLRRTGAVKAKNPKFSPVSQPEIADKCGQTRTNADECGQMPTNADFQGKTQKAATATATGGCDIA
jgi:hypothetical protein